MSAAEIPVMFSAMMHLDDYIAFKRSFINVAKCNNFMQLKNLSRLMQFEGGVEIKDRTSW
jgi:hypothetical protein